MHCSLADQGIRKEQQKQEITGKGNRWMLNEMKIIYTKEDMQTYNHSTVIKCRFSLKCWLFTCQTSILISKMY